MGHGKCFNSPPSRELIADSVRVYGQRPLRRRHGLHLNCDKSPRDADGFPAPEYSVIFVSGRPWRPGKPNFPIRSSSSFGRCDDPGRDPKVSDSQSDQVERSACPTCGSCSEMFTANSMNCLTKRWACRSRYCSLLATLRDRKQLFLNAGKRIVELTKRYYSAKRRKCTAAYIAIRWRLKRHDAGYRDGWID
ncbi:dihydroxy-acid dehydratase [Escherichia coli]